MTALARHTDPDTAKAAAGAMAGVEGDLRALVLLALRDHQVRGGLTVSEIAAVLARPRDSISPRMKDLVKAGAVYDGGGRRIPEGMTRPQIIWELARTTTQEAAVIAALEGL